MDEHVPMPKPWEDWTHEDHLKFRMFSSHCPMCRYKHEYGILANLMQTAANTTDENVQAGLVPIIKQKQAELIELGLFIAGSVDDANKQAGSPHHN